MMDVQYRISPEVSNEDLNALFTDAWPGRRPSRDFAPVLSHSLGYICAYRQGELVGFINIAWDGGMHAFLLDTTVRTDYRRQGIGRELVRQAENFARQRRAEWLHVDFEPELEQFYRNCGFRASPCGLDQPERAQKR